jgi:hypothetical protein
MFAVLINKKKDPTIWLSVMRKFPWSGTCVILANSPSPSPKVVEAGIQNTVPIIRAPKPKHARPNPNHRDRIFSWRSGLSDEYQIEHFRPTTTESVLSPITNLPLAATAPIVRASVLPALGADVPDKLASSLYPTYLQQTVLSPSPGSAQSRSVLNQSPMRVVPGTSLSLPQAGLPSSPSPLGDWPKPDIISRSVDKGKGKQASVPNNVAFAVPPSPSEARVRQDRPVSGQRYHTSPPSLLPTKPMGPRRRSESFDMTNKAPV